MNNRMTNLLMQMLEQQGIPTHFVKELSDRETVVKRVEIVPLEVIVRNISAGHFAQNYGVEEGSSLTSPPLSFPIKMTRWGPLINSYHARALKLATGEEIDTIVRLAFQVNEALKAFFLSVGIRLVDIKLEFGRTGTGPSSWRMRSPRTPAACGTKTPMRSWTRTASAGIWATWKAPIRRSCAACWRSSPKAPTWDQPRAPAR